MIRNTESTYLVYHHMPDPTEGTPILASFSGASCLTQCQHRLDPDVKVGSMSCRECGAYAGSAGKTTEVFDAKGAYGEVTHTRKIWCKRQKETP